MSSGQKFGQSLAHDRLRNVGCRAKLCGALMNPTDLQRIARDDLVSLLDQLLLSRDVRAEVAARSYVHDNGFTKIVLRTRNGAQGALRLHLWETDGAGPGNVHNHCWDFSSVILAGELAFEEFVVDDDGDVGAQFHEYAPSTDFEYELRPAHLTRLRMTSSGTWKPGDAYKMKAETLHRTWAHVPGTVSLVSQGPHHRERADVYVTRPEGVPTYAANAALTPAELESRVADLRQLLSKAPL